MKYNEEYVKELKKIYIDIKEIIKKRLKEFEFKGNYETYLELLFCILTPQSKARKCWDAVCKLEKEGIFKIDENKLKEIIKEIRFYNNKSKYILEAINTLKQNPDLLKNLKEMKEEERRDFVIKRFKGIGMKEASHFLRNIGLGNNIAILDRHILKNLHKLNVIKKIPKTLTKKIYIDIENKMQKFSNYINIPLNELDLLLWYKETNEVFK